jgi:plastocyanin
MVRDHEAVNRQALDLVQRLHVTSEENPTSAALTSQAEATRERLSHLSGGAFDRAYVENEVAFHRTVNAALRDTLIPGARNAELKSLLQSGLGPVHRASGPCRGSRAGPEMRLRALVSALALSAPGVAAPASPAEHVIVMRQMRFSDLPANLRVGDAIVWVNRDVVAHTATARDRGFDVELQPNQSRRIVLRRAGAIAFYCRYHPAMTGTLRVAP